MTPPMELFDRMNGNLAEALENTDNDHARYQIRSATQRLIIAQELTLGEIPEPHLRQDPDSEGKA